MAEGGSLLDAFRQWQPQRQSGEPSLDDLAAYQRVLAQQPVEGVNVHERAANAPRAPAWIAEQTIEPVPFGSLADPVSQVAFLGAPGLLRGAKGLLETAGSPGPRVGGWMAGERGNLGPVPRGQAGEPLPASAVRTPEGELKRLYHGTNRVYPDFEVSQYSSGAGGDLYGPGIYMTESPQIAGEYSRLAGPYRDATWKEVEEYFRPGKVVPGWGGQDKVVAFDPGDAAAGHWNWRVQVQAVDRQGQPIAGERPRWHSSWPKVESTPNIRPVYADITRPFDISAPTDVDALNTIIRNVPGRTGASIKEGIREYLNAMGQRLTNETFYNGLAHALGGKAQANRLLAEQGYDGITHMGGAVTGGQPHRVYIAFHPDQVYPGANVEAVLPARSP